MGKTVQQSVSETASIEQTAGHIPRPIWYDLAELSKPNMIYSNVLVAWMSYFIASGVSDFDWAVMLWLGLGLSLLIGGSCVLNNIYDRDADRLMIRTKLRVLAMERFKISIAWFYGLFLVLAGLLVLFWTQGIEIAVVGLLGFLIYVFVYTALLKRKSTANTWVGGLSGAVPPVMGALAAPNGSIQVVCCLFLILFLWQPPHFFALSIYYIDDYRRSDFKMLPVVRGVHFTARRIRIWVILLVSASFLPFFITQASLIYLSGVILLGFSYIVLAFQKFAKNITTWSRYMFFASLVYLVGILLFWILDRIFV